MNKDKIFDELLILKCHEGDTKAFRLLIKRWNKKLIYFACKFTHDVESAQDVVQNSWIAIHKGLHKLQDPSKFTTWAFRITYNKSMDALRSSRNKNEVALNDQADFEEVKEEDDSWNTISDLLKKLPEQHKLILTLFYLEQQSVKQIASVLKLPEGTVKSRIFYARELLKRKYKEVNHEK